MASAEEFSRCILRYELTCIKFLIFKSERKCNYKAFMQGDKLRRLSHCTHFYIQELINLAQLIAQACWRQLKLPGCLMSFGTQPCILSHLNGP